jgi:hypothetical protein
MEQKVSLTELEHGFECPEEWYVGFDRETGKVVLIDDQTFRAADDAEDQGLELGGVDLKSGCMEEMLPLAWAVVTDHSSSRFERLPARGDFHEYRKIEAFIETLPAGRARDQLWRAISRKGAFRRFQDEAHRQGVIEHWYRFRQEALRQMLRDWAKDRELIVVEDTVKP